ncbi:MAG: hypothetical protein WHS65_08800 [Melioribacteraceae bacterium]
MKKILINPKITSIIHLCAVGFFSILAQVIILRELNVAFYGIELIYILSFGIWLIGSALGASIGKYSFMPKINHIQILFHLSTLFLLGDFIFIRSIRYIFSSVSGGYLPFLQQIFVLIIALIPLSLISGLLFQWTAKNFLAENETLAKAYAIESAGAVVGGLCSTLLLSLKVNNFSAALFCCLVLTITASISFEKIRMTKNFFSVLTFVVIFILFLFNKKIDYYMTSWNHPFLIKSIDTPYGRVSISSFENQINVFIDDALAYETESLEAEEIVHISTLQLEKIDKILVLGGGFEGIIYELLKLPVKKIDYVEINKELIDAVKNYLPENLSNPLKNPKVKIVYDDPRKFLSSKHSYDLILIGMPEPMSAQNNRFYTKEFFQQCYNSLTQSGILAFRIRSSENIWTNQLKERNKSIYNALKINFENTIILPGVIFIASKSKLIKNVSELINRFNERKLETKLVSPQYINYVFTNDRFYEIQRIFNEISENVNSDLQPVCYAYTTSIWLSKFFPELAYKNIPLAISSIKQRSNKKLLIIALIILFAFFLILRNQDNLKRILVVFTAGFVGMISEVILLIIYQNQNGILYRDIGILLTSFMIGLSIGAYLTNYFISSLQKKEKYAGIILIASFLLLNFAVYFFMKTILQSSLIIFLVLLLLDGFFTAGIFSFASFYKTENQQKLISQLYASDLIGGCIGSLTASLILIPFYGLQVSVILLVILLFLCLTIII